MTKRKPISEKVKIILMGKASGKCEFRGCEESVITEVLTKTSGNFSNFAHIVADSPDGPRGDKIRSPLLCNSEENIMVMCRIHHKLIDDNPDTYTEEILKDMKREHEEYIKELNRIKRENKVTAIKYVSNISNRTVNIDDESIEISCMKQKKYCKGNILDLSGNSYDEKDNENFFEIEAENLRTSFLQQIKPLLKKEENKKMFLFAIAPQPLLIYLGTLFSDITNIEVQQLQREPIKEWYLEEKGNEKFEFNTIMPKKRKSKVALNISITGDIAEERITNILGNECDIIKIESNVHGNDIIKSKDQLVKYKQEIRKVFENIKDIYGRDCEINIFPAMPLSLAVETGRCWMKKAHPKLVIYDEKSGFKKALEIQYEEE